MVFEYGLGFEFGFGNFYPIGLPVVAFLFLFGLDEAQRGQVWFVGLSRAKEVLAKFSENLGS